MKNTYDFDDMGEYVAGGVVVAVILAIVFLLFGAIFQGDRVSDGAEKKNFYLALEGKPTQDSSALKAVGMIKDILNEMKESNDVSKKIGCFAKFSDFNYGNYRKYLYNETGDVLAVLNGEKKDISPSIPTPKWSNFFKLLGVVFLIMLSLFMTINFCYESVTSSESLMDWPWKKPWTYILILLMFPFLFVCVLVEVIYRLCTRSFSKIRAPRNNNRRYEELPRRNTISEQKKNKEVALAEIDAVNKDIDSFRKEYVLTCRGETVAKRIKNLEKDIAKGRQDLVDMGDRIEYKQRSLASSKKELAELMAAQNGEDGRIIKSSVGDFEQIRNIEHIAAVKVEGSQLIVYTDVIHIRYLTAVYEIGVITITIDMMTGNFSLRNLCSTHPQGNTHPYGSGGNICWGKMKYSIENALGERQFPSAIQFMIKSLYSAKGDNPLAVRKFRKVKGI